MPGWIAQRWSAEVLDPYPELDGAVLLGMAFKKLAKANIPKFTISLHPFPVHDRSPIRTRDMRNQNRWLQANNKII